ncbi:MAG: VWA domain-containing protein [Gammaproteobacteria bacterium]|nr:VWA domain-containing protein [Gammaproteobacteria bacterium]
MNTSGLDLLFASLAWREPLWGLLALLPIVAVLAGQRLRDSHAYAAEHLQPWVSYRPRRGFLAALLSKNTAYGLAWLLIAIALAGPRLAIDSTGHAPRSDIDIMLVVDVSRSMQAMDIAPSRLRRATIEIEELLQRATGTRIGIIVFAARPHLFVPLSSDPAALRHYLQSLDSLQLPTHGSEPIAALAMAQRELDHNATPSAIVLISDGDFPELDTAKLPAAVESSAIPVYGLGLASPEGESIALAGGGWLQHEGRSVISRLNEEHFQHLLNDGSRYSLATDDDADWQKLYDQGIATLARKAQQKADAEIVWDELFVWPLSAALLLLWLALVPFGPVVRRRPQQTVTTSLLSVAMVIIAVGLFGQHTAAAAAPTDAAGRLDIARELDRSQAFQTYRNGDYASAALLYKAIPGYAARLGEGVCYYRLKDYKAAIRQFSLAVLAADEDRERATALFNLGNAQFQAGDYDQATSIYSDALRYNPALDKVRHNLTLSHALQQAVEAQLNNANRFSRSGAGPQLAPSDETMENNQGGGLALDQDEDLQADDLPLPEPANLSDAGLAMLIDRGLQHIRLAAAPAASAEREALTRSRLSVISARLLMSRLDDPQTEMWQRLFEMEEGFPAPLAEPRDIPGVSPW